MPKAILQAVLVALTASVGCTLQYGDDFDRKQCAVKADCTAPAAQIGSPLECRNHACQRPLCFANDNCPANASCISNRCVGNLGDAGSRTCSTDDECGPDNACSHDGFCFTPRHADGGVDAAVRSDASGMDAGPP